MRRLAQVIAGTLALAFMLMYVPWDLSECTTFSCHTSDRWEFDVSFLIMMVLMQALVYAIVTTVVLIGVLGMRDTGTASEDAVLAALGQSRRTAVRGAARRALVDAGFAIGMGFLITGALHMWKVVESNSEFGAASGAWIERLTVAAVFTGALVAAHVIDAMRPRKSPVDLLHADAAEPSARRFSLCARAMVFGGLAAAAGGVIAGVAIAHDPANGDASALTRTVVQGAQITLWFALVILALAVGVPLVMTALRPALTEAARLMAILKAPQAAAIVRARADAASGASTRTVLAISGLALIAGALASVSPAPKLAPEYVGAVSVFPAETAAEFAPMYREIEGVGAVIEAPLVSEEMGIVGVDLEVIAPLDPVLADLLRRHPGAVVGQIGVSGETVYSLAAQGIDATGIVPTSTCCLAFIERDRITAETTGTSLLIYATEGADPAAVAQLVYDFSPVSSANNSYSTSMAYSVGTYPTSWFEYVYYALIALVCVGPVIALAMGVANRRRRDNATLAALGASRRTLRGAAIAETSVLAALAVGFGLLAGAVLQSILAVSTRAEASLDGVITESYIEVALRSVDWGNIAWMFVIAVSAFAAIAWLISRTVGGQLPAEALRAADAGKLS